MPTRCHCEINFSIIQVKIQDVDQPRVCTVLNIHVYQFNMVKRTVTYNSIHYIRDNKLSAALST